MKSKFPVPAEVIEYWIANWPTETCKDMGLKFGYDGQVVIRHLKKNGVVVPRELSYRLVSEKMKGRTSSTPELDQQIKALYLDYPVKRLAKMLGVGDTFLNIRMRQLGLEIPKELIEQRKKDSQLKKGNIPVNKGKTWDEYMPVDAQAKSRKTTFKKGNIPHNAYNEIGKITIRSKRDGSERYKYICIELGKWELLQQHSWIAVNGPIPDGHVIRFIDGDSMNCDVSNLKCVSMAENLSLNNMSDNAIATKLSFVGRGKVDKELRDVILKDHPELIEIRRLEHQLKKELRNQSK